MSVAADPDCRSLILCLRGHRADREQDDPEQVAHRGATPVTRGRVQESGLDSVPLNALQQRTFRASVRGPRPVDGLPWPTGPGLVNREDGWRVWRKRIGAAPRNRSRSGTGVEPWETLGARVRRQRNEWHAVEPGVGISREEFDTSAGCLGPLAFWPPAARIGSRARASNFGAIFRSKNDLGLPIEKVPTSG